MRRIQIRPFFGELRNAKRRVAESACFTWVYPTNKLPTGRYLKTKTAYSGHELFLSDVMRARLRARCLRDLREIISARVIFFVRDAAYDRSEVLSKALTRKGFVIFSGIVLKKTSPKAEKHDTWLYAGLVSGTRASMGTGSTETPVGLA